MIKNILTLIILFALVGLIFAPSANAKTKVAFIGNSITYGAYIPNREKNSVPAQLQAYLGKDYEVVNFGVSGSTVINRDDYPYILTPEYAAAKKFRPDIVLIKLGTNDSKPQMQKHFDQFISDYQKLIDGFRNPDSRPQIILLTPVKCYLDEGTGPSQKFLSEKIVPAIEKLAYDNGLEIVNLQRLFGNEWESQMMPDKLHPSSIGAGVIAKEIGNYLTLRYGKTPTLPAFALKGNPFDFHGYTGYGFKTDGIDCKIVMPRREAQGKPWVLRARFWGHEPQTDISLLEKGFHIVYCDVADLYGSPKACKRWDKLYRRLVKDGFSRKAVLEGMSRGGLIVYNWAMSNPEKTACIYADAPVMDLASWPAGLGKGEGSAIDTETMMKVYGFNSFEELKAYEMKRMRALCDVLARAEIPVIHVVGDADKVVPYEENTKIFEDEMAKRNRPVKVIHKPGVGHHPHSLSNPAPITEFILDATTGRQNECVHAVPGNEFRSGAGWAADYEWHAVADDIQQTLEGRKLGLLLLGNSITQGWGGNRKGVTYKPGKRVMDEMYGKDRWESAGISGDRTQNLLWRLRNYNYNVCRPDHVVIAIGVNNIVGDDSEPDDIAGGIIAVAAVAEKVFPESDIILLGLYPTGKDQTSAARKKYERIHQKLASHSFERARYVDPTDWFVDENGEIRKGLYGGDYIHFTEEGYRTATSNILRLLK